MSKNVHYCDRALVVSPYHYGLCRTEQAFQKELKRLKVPRDQWPTFIDTAADACVHFFEQSNGELLAIVCLGSTKGRSKSEVQGLLIHEAVHVWQEIRRTLGEKEPSDEFEAYSVQTIAQKLIEAL